MYAKAASIHLRCTAACCETHDISDTKGIGGAPEVWMKGHNEDDGYLSSTFKCLQSVSLSQR